MRGLVCLGWGRKSHDEETADRTVDVHAERGICPDSGTPLEKRGWTERSVVETPRKKPEKITFRLPKRYCPHCRRTVTPQALGVLPKAFSGINSSQMLLRCTTSTAALWGGSVSIYKSAPGVL